MQLIRQLLLRFHSFLIKGKIYCSRVTMAPKVSKVEGTRGRGPGSAAMRDPPLVMGNVPDELGNASSDLFMLAAKPRRTTKL